MHPNVPLPAPGAFVGFRIDPASFPHLTAAIQAIAAADGDAGRTYNAWLRLSDDEKQLAGWCYVMEKAQAARQASEPAAA